MKLMKKSSFLIIICIFMLTAKAYSKATTQPQSHTKCPVVETKCPTVKTKCPIAETKCPTYQTKCPTTKTKCPIVNTKCPTVNTKCPTASTKCPVIETKCPTYKTKCPIAETKCPTYQTKCPTTKTKCPIVNTKCPIVNTKCPTAKTKCPVIETKCPTYKTKCPIVETKCPSVRTSYRTNKSSASVIGSKHVLDVNLLKNKVSNLDKFKKSIMIKNIFSSTGADEDIPEIKDLGTGSIYTEVLTDPDFKRIMEVVPGMNWGELTSGVSFENLDNYTSSRTSISFKIKSDDLTAIYLEALSKKLIYDFEDGKDLGNGWYEITVPLSDFGLEAPTIKSFGIHSGLNNGGIFYITDVQLKVNK